MLPMRPEENPVCSGRATLRVARTDPALCCHVLAEKETAIRT